MHCDDVIGHESASIMPAANVDWYDCWDVVLLALGITSNSMCVQ